jgi:hypothetical protein
MSPTLSGSRASDRPQSSPTARRRRNSRSNEFARCAVGSSSSLHRNSRQRPLTWAVSGRMTSIHWAQLRRSTSVAQPYSWRAPSPNPLALVPRKIGCKEPVDHGDAPSAVKCSGRSERGSRASRVASTDRTGRCSVTLETPDGSGRRLWATPTQMCTDDLASHFAIGPGTLENPRLSRPDVMAGLYSHNAMIGNAIGLPDAARQHETTATREREHRLRLLLVMAQGPAGALAEAWRSYAHIEDARASGAAALRNPHVLHVAIVEDGWGHVGSANPLGFVEWVG